MPLDARQISPARSPRAGCASPVNGGRCSTRSRDAASSVSPLQVYDAARTECPELGLTTVYRTLELLSEIGALRRVHGLDRCEAFVPAEAAHGHTVVCGGLWPRHRVHRLRHADTVVAAAGRQTGYVITDHFLQLSGTCGECSARTRPGPGSGSRRGER